MNNSVLPRRFDRYTGPAWYIRRLEHRTHGAAGDRAGLIFRER
jgi:hypothetical protein